MAAQTLHRSAVECYGPDSSRCGYCSRPNSAHSFGVVAHRLDVRDYQNMLDAGWRRSGSYLYRPDLATTCCPSYVIRLEASRFVPSSTHKRVLKRLRRFKPDRFPTNSSSSSSTHHQQQSIPSPEQTDPNSTDGSLSPTLCLSGDNEQNSANPTTQRNVVINNRNSSSSNNNNKSLRNPSPNIERDRLLDIVRSVVAQCARMEQFGKTLSVNNLNERVRSQIKVFPPRVSTHQRRTNLDKRQVKFSPHSNSNSDPNSSPDRVPSWCTNAAMFLAAIERNIMTTSVENTTSSAVNTATSITGTPLDDRGKDSANGSSKRERRSQIDSRQKTERQMEIANAIASPLRQAVNPEYSVSVTIPGFLNLFPQPVSSDEGDDDILAKESDEDIDMNVHRDDMESDTGVSVKRVIDQYNPPKTHTRCPKPSFLLGQQLQQAERTSFDDIATVKKKGGHNKRDTNNISTRDAECERYSGAEKNKAVEEGDERRRSNDGDDDAHSGSTTGMYFGSMNAQTRDDLFSMEVVPSQFRPDAYEIFRRYQMTVHKESEDECARDNYLRFLVDSPLVTERVSASSTDDAWYGSFHILYRLGGRLFAVGVVDVLPKCLSSVYLFYDPAFSKLSPGTLSALKEIEWVQRGRALRHFPSLQFYYMGFYIHSCPKMRYKMGFVPSELLCDVTKNWISTENARKALEAPVEQLQLGRGVTRLAPPDMKPAPEAADFDLSEDELDRLTNECRLELSYNYNDGGRERRRLSFRTLARTVHSQYVGYVEYIRVKLRRFVQLVGRSSNKFFIHVL